MELTQKEMSLMKDLKKQEQICVDKYSRYAAQAHDGQLKQLFTDLAAAEKRHLDTLLTIESGGTPAMQAGGKSTIATGFSATYGIEESPDKKDDAYLCNDLLATEKHASALYDTCVFEFAQPPLRQALNGIQSQEQNHGEVLYRYMKINGMYA